MSDKHEFNEKLASALRIAASQAFGNEVTAETWLNTRLKTYKATPLQTALGSHEGEIRVKRDLMEIKAALN